jgi:mono/diheme cytochrome c family protein
VYETERIEQVMPQFDLADADVRALRLFLKSRTEHHVPEIYRPPHVAHEKTLVEGRRVVAKYNCVGCHVIENRGGAILARYTDTPTLAPPVLNGEGAKVQPDWMFSFLKHPIPLRPWLKVRMPTFNMSDKEATALIEYFMAQEKQEIPFVYVDLAKIPGEHITAGRTLMSPDYLNCFSCHQQGDKKPEGPEEGWAPDLTLAKERLNPDWIIRWLSDPQAVQPGTKMPSFYNLTDDSPDGPEDVLGGDDRKQIEALRDYILTLGDKSSVMAAAGRPTGATRN